MKYRISLENITEKKIYPLGEDFHGISKSGEEISFTNYYMEKNGKPFFAVSGEFHFSRMEDSRWEDELIKMKMAGINVIATYVFWNHHEEEEGIFDFTGRRNLRKFMELCQKYDLYVILRVGPFDHGEVRNGGIPDWMYGKPFEVRHTNEGFIHYTRLLYTKIAQEVEGLFFQDDGPIIGTQIDNEYMHSSAAWEITTGISDEWIYGGSEGDAYMLKLKKLAAECGLTPVFYTCTGWGGASTPDSMMPLWGGYAFQPWLFYSYKGEHPSTKEYVYQDLHNNAIPSSYNFEPKYQPEDRPYACCEMGGGMMCSYYYRFVLPFKSVDAMANIKLASGCNFLGYYVFQGGSNPVGKHGTFLNEAQVPKISYDYQACLGEYGQVRESYLRLKTLHYFVNTYADAICKLKTYLPEGASDIDPKDLDTLRFAVRTDGRGGFLFLNNYQDHQVMHTKKKESVELTLPNETIMFEGIGLASDENCILPFHFDLQGIDLVKATAQPVTDLEIDGIETYIFMRPEGMTSVFTFEQGAKIKEKVNADSQVEEKESVNIYQVDEEKEIEMFTVVKGDKECRILCISREFSNQLYVVDGKGIVFSKAAVLEREDQLYLEGYDHKTKVYTYPENLLAGSSQVNQLPEEDAYSGLGVYEAGTKKKTIQPELNMVADNRYIITLPEKFMSGVKDTILRINYHGDIGHAFINGRMISDNFCNNDTWEIGLKDFAEELEHNPLTIYITPLKEGVNVNVESTMAARMEEVDAKIGEITSISLAPLYEMRIF